MELEEFTAFLKAHYLPTDHEDVSFRGMVSQFIRVWGKENLDVYRPLHAVGAQRGEDCVNNLMRIFDEYGQVSHLIDALRLAEADEAALKKALKQGVVPRINKSEYSENQRSIAEIEEEIRGIKENLAMFALSISAIANREMLELKNQKDRLLQVKLQLDSKLARVKRSIGDSRFVKSRSFESLKEFFPNIDVDRLVSVELFHSNLAKILKTELQDSEQNLQGQLDKANTEIAAIDKLLTERLGAIDSPTVIVDRVFDVSRKLHTAKYENSYYDKIRELSGTKQSRQLELSERKQAILTTIEERLNRKMREVVTAVFGQQRKSPRITLSEGGYEFEVFEDTGTGTAYSNLIVFDLTVFFLTALPVLIHDSLLFKNIENRAVSNLLDIYVAASRQTFIAIDEIHKYGQESAKILQERTVAQLSDDNVLYIKDWRKKP